MDAPTHQKKESTFDKVIFGLLIGGAIGSVLGLTVAPTKGSDIRTKLKSTGGKMVTKGKGLLTDNEDAISLIANKSKGFLSFFTDKVFGKKPERKESDILSWLDEMSEIPSEAKEETR